MRAEMAEGRLSHRFWEAVVRLAYAVYGRAAMLFELIHGAEPATGADETREADHECLRRAFPNIEIDGSVALADEGQQMRATPDLAITAFDEAPPRSAASAHRPAP